MSEQPGMTGIGKMVRAQLIPLQDMNLVLPNTCIAEVLPLSQLQTMQESPDWLLGTLAWRGMDIPVICFQHLIGANQSEVDDISTNVISRVVVLNGLTENNDLPFYGIAIQGIPHLITLNSTNINAVTRPAEPISLALEQTMIGDQAALIPDLLQLETLLSEAVIYL